MKRFRAFAYPEQADLALFWTAEFARDGEDEKAASAEAVRRIMQRCREAISQGPSALWPHESVGSEDIR